MITKRKAPHSAFKPGQSGNPGGRPKAVKDLIEAAREHTQEAVGRLAFWMRSEHPAASPMAAKELLDRGWGRPVQPNEHTGKDGEPLVIPSVAITIARSG